MGSLIKTDRKGSVTYNCIVQVFRPRDPTCGPAGADDSWFLPRETSQNQTVVAFVITGCHSSPFIPFFLFVNLGELPLTRGSLWWVSAVPDHFRARPRNHTKLPASSSNVSPFLFSRSGFLDVKPHPPVSWWPGLCAAALAVADSVLLNGREVIC